MKQNLLETKSVRDLRNIEFNVPDLPAPGKPFPRQEQEPFEVSFNGSSLKIGVGYYPYHEAGSNDLKIQINVYAGGPYSIAYLIMVVRGDGEKYIVTNEVKNVTGNIKGLGRALWEVSLPLVQKIANRWKAPVVDIVEKIPTSGLSEDKWDELFVPLLKKYGYIKKKSGVKEWEKPYFPGQE